MNKVTNTYAAPTRKQIEYAEALARKKGYRYLGQAYKACFGKHKVNDFNREETSRLIDWLKS